MRQGKQSDASMISVGNGKGKETWKGGTAATSANRVVPGEEDARQGERKKWSARIKTQDWEKEEIGVRE
jgi:hypothetical protein